MKIRRGFVSNSSSSSFICDVCGRDKTGYECENGHYFCQDEADIQEGDIIWDDYYNIPKEHCPICQLMKLKDDEAILYLLKKHKTTKREVIKEINQMFSNYSEFKEFLKDE